jgi:hypothetical protein
MLGAVPSADKVIVIGFRVGSAKGARKAMQLKVQQHFGSKSSEMKCDVIDLNGEDPDLQLKKYLKGTGLPLRDHDAWINLLKSQMMEIERSKATKQ